MDSAVIAIRPPNDGREWDCQCARCGSSVTYEPCGSCGGDGEWEVAEDYWGNTEEVRCDDCDGRGGWQVCLSDAAWCEAHPIEGRAAVPRGRVEWFVIRGEASHG